MSIKIGDIDVANEIVELSYQLRRALLILEKILQKNTSLSSPTQEEINQIDTAALDFVAKKFPNMGISKK